MYIFFFYLHRVSCPGGIVHEITFETGKSDRKISQSFPFFLFPFFFFGGTEGVSWIIQKYWSHSAQNERLVYRAMELHDLFIDQGHKLIIDLRKKNRGEILKCGFAILFVKW